MNNVFSLSSGENIPIVLKRGVKNITLRPRVTPRREIHISVPRFTSVNAALRFMESKRAWIEKILSNAVTKVKLCDKDKICVFGEIWEINAVEIGGQSEFLERRVRDKIKAEFLKKVKAEIKKLPPEFHPKKIAAHDTTSRWGSCSSSGTISFSWRLAFAPPHIMRYVICHECAHLREMNHSVAFWALTANLYGDGVGRAKLWLKQYGSTLYRYL